jgi:hypothetical protein
MLFRNFANAPTRDEIMMMAMMIQNTPIITASLESSPLHERLNNLSLC